MSIKNYALKLKIKDILVADTQQIDKWVIALEDYINELSKENGHKAKEDLTSQKNAWLDSFKFIQENLAPLSEEKQEHELVFEYSLPGTAHERPDIFILTNNKVISLEFKRKNSPQVSAYKDDIAQALRYRDWLNHHHQITKEKRQNVISYLVCTTAKAVKNHFRGIDILTKDNFYKVIDSELEKEEKCNFSDKWLASGWTAMPDMLKAINILYGENRIPYLSDVNQACLDSILKHITWAKENQKKVLIFLTGVPGSGKTGIGQSIVFMENQKKFANKENHKKLESAVYLSGNGPLVEVLQNQIDSIHHNKAMAENIIQGMKEFKATYFRNAKAIPPQSILVFDEAQRAWNIKRMGDRYKYSEVDGLFMVGDRIYERDKYAVIVALYGTGQTIYHGEESDLRLWKYALTRKDASDWLIIASEDILDTKLREVSEKQKIRDSNVHLSASLRAEFIDCSKWVEEAICKKDANIEIAKAELAKLQNTPLRIYVTRDLSKVCKYKEKIDKEHPDWQYGILISNFAKDDNEGKQNKNSRKLKISPSSWFGGECKTLEKPCKVFDCQGLELDCPIILFKGEYYRKDGIWKADDDRLKNYICSEYKKGQNQSIIISPDKLSLANNILINNYRVLFTRARKEMILLIPENKHLDETYKYFIEMGMDEL